MLLCHDLLMNLKHIRTFLTVVEHGTVSSAAAQLRLTQPALSRQLRALQDEIQLNLFDQISRRLVLTSNGKVFLQHCRDLMAQADAVLATAQSLGSGKIGELRIGGAPQTIARFFPSFLERYERDHANIRVNLVEASGARQIEMVQQGDLHFAITIVFGKRGRLRTLPLPTIPLLALAHRRYRLGTPGVMDLRRLEDLPVLLVGREFAARAIFDAACRMARFTPNVRFEGSTPHTLAALAEGGHGVAIVPGTLDYKRKHVQVLRLQFRGEPVVLPLAIHWDDRRPLARHAQDFPALFSAHVRTELGRRKVSDLRSQ
jgi:DNA-binding transcriptional LysR family regulator